MHITPILKCYIGLTNKDPEERFAKGFGYEKNRVFFHDIVKFGWDNIEHKILHKNLSKEEAEYFERHFIKFMDSTNPDYGYNQDNGGSSKGRFTASTRLKQSLSRKGIPTNRIRDITNQRFGRLIAIKLVGSDKKHGKIWECICDCGKTYNCRSTPLLSGKTQSCGCIQAKKINQFDLSGELIQSFDSIREASIITNIAYENILRVLRGKTKNPKKFKFIWKYADENV